MAWLDIWGPELPGLFCVFVDVDLDEGAGWKRPPGGSPIVPSYEDLSSTRTEYFEGKGYALYVLLPAIFFLGHHYAADVIAGLFLGAAVHMINGKFSTGGLDCR